MGKLKVHVPGIYFKDFYRGNPDKLYSVLKIFEVVTGHFYKLPAGRGKKSKKEFNSGIKLATSKEKANETMPIKVSRNLAMKLKNKIKKEVNYLQIESNNAIQRHLVLDEKSAFFKKSRRKEVKSVTFYIFSKFILEQIKTEIEEVKKLIPDSKIQYDVLPAKKVPKVKSVYRAINITLDKHCYISFKNIDKYSKLELYALREVYDLATRFFYSTKPLYLPKIKNKKIKNVVLENNLKGNQDKVLDSHDSIYMDSLLYNEDAYAEVVFSYLLDVTDVVKIN